MQVNGNTSTNYYTSYKSNTNVKAISGFSLNSEGELEVKDADENWQGFAEFGDYQEFHKAWMSQGVTNPFNYNGNNESNTEEIYNKVNNSVAYTRCITASVKTQEMYASQSESGEMVFSYKESEQSFQIWINSDGNNKTYSIEGTDKNGELFSKEFNPFDVDPENADFPEFSALCMYINNTNETADLLANEYFSSDDILEKKNYFDMLGNFGNDDAFAGVSSMLEHANKLFQEMQNFINDMSNMYSMDVPYGVDLLTMDMDEINTDDRGISHYATNAPEEVKNALAEAMDETGYSMGGKMNYISQMLIKQVENSHNGVANPSDIFGSTVESAISAAKELLDRIEHPLEPISRRGADVQKYIMQEKEFLETFISKLEKNDSINETSIADNEFKPVFRTLYSDTGVNVSVYKAPDFDSEHPIYKVEMQDKDGNITERMVDVSKVNPHNCDSLDFYAYTANLKESGQGNFEDTVLKAAIARAQKDAEENSKSWDMTESYNWVEIVKQILNSEKDYGDAEGFLNWQNFYELLA